MNFINPSSVWTERLQNISIIPQLNSLFFKTSSNKVVFQIILILTFAITANSATYTVNTLLDNESNGCGLGSCTLREAINEANALPNGDTINFTPALNGTIILNGSHISITSDITINGNGARNLTVSGNNASRVFVVRGTSTDADISGLTIAGGNALPIIIAGITISDGGGILNTDGATLNLSDVAIVNNEATTLGGGISTRAILLTTTTTNITRSTISGNNSAVGGGGIGNFGTVLISSAITNITNSTISNNNTLAEGGGISNTLGTVNLTNNTISDNQSVVAGGGVVNVVIAPLGTVYLRNNIIARNSAVVGLDLISSDVLGTFNSQGNNLIGNNLHAEASFAASVVVGGVHSPNLNADFVGSIGIGFTKIYPLLGNLQDNGGQTNTRLPLVNSPALDKGNNCVTDGSCGSAFVNEQRGSGFARIANSTIDIGATEGPAAPNMPYVVTTLADDESNGCGVGECTLREAIAASNVAPDFDTINFEPTLTGTIFLNGNQLVISSNVTINGLGARTLTVSGNNSSRVFLIAAPVLGGDFDVEINGLTISDGSALPVTGLAGDGGGVLNGALLGIVSGKSTLTLHEVNIYNNFATTLGGGVATRLGSETIITKSLIHGNSCNAVPFIPGGDVGGGGVSNAALSTTIIANSTIANNDTLAAGGGILNAAGQMHLTNNTIVANQSGLVGGGVVSLLGVVPPYGVTNLRNTIIAKNNALIGAGLVSSDVVGDVLGLIKSFNSLGNNFIGNNVDAELHFEASLFIGTDPQPNVKADFVGNIVIINQMIDPMLEPLQDNGGPTDSCLPSPLSHVMNKGNICVYTNTCAVNPAGKNPHIALTNDQRGTIMSRVLNTNPEIGATELPLAPTAANVSISGRVLDEYDRGIYRVVISLTDSSGAVFTTISNPFGYYRFENISAGETVVLTPVHRSYIFSPQVISVNEDITDLNISVISSSIKNNQSKMKFNRMTNLLH